MKKPVLTFLFILSLAIPLTAAQGGSEHLQSDSLNVSFVGEWIVCNSMTVECDEINDIAYIGTGGSIHIVDISDPSSPQGLTELDDFGLIRDIHHNDQYLYAGDWDFGLRLISVSNPSEPVLLGSFQTPGLLWGLDVAGSYAYLACGNNGLKVVSVADPANPQEVGSSSVGGYVTDVMVQDTFAIVIDLGVLRVYSVASPENPVEIGSINLPGTAWNVVLQGHHAFVAAGGSGLRVISLAHPESPEEVGFCDVPGYSRCVAIHDNYAYLANGGSGVKVISIVDRTNPEQIGFYNTSHYAWALSVCGSMMAVADGEGGMLILQYSGPVSADDPGSPGIQMPRSFSLSQNYPNPFNPVTSIQLTVPAGFTGNTALIIYDVRGKEVRTLIDEQLAAGNHTVVWDGRGTNGEKVASGTYLFTLKTGDRSVVRKMTVVR